jgi:hypothetical protein
MRGMGNWGKWVVAALGLLFVVGAASAQPRTPANRAGAQSPLGTGFTFQGRLSDGAGPVDGLCTFTFELYDSPGSGSPPTGGTLLGTQRQPGVVVKEGHFAAILNEGGEFGADAFTGQARYLQITVDCGNGSSTLSPRQALMATPYALYAERTGEHSHWGQDWSGSGTGLRVYGGQVGLSGSGNAVGVIGTGSTGIHGSSTAAEGRGVYGQATTDTGVSYGVFGQSESPQGFAVYGQALGSTGGNHGVAGYSESTAGTGVFGWASASSGSTRGVSGRTDSPTGVGVYGLSRAASGESFGVFGQSISPAGRGVYGRATASEGDATGVYGQSDADGGTGVYGQGRWGVQGHSTAEQLGVGVTGKSSSQTLGIGVFGESTSETLGIGVFGSAEGADSVGVSGKSPNGEGVLGTGNVGVKGESTSASGRGVFGTGQIGVEGQSASASGRGVVGHATATSGNTYGVIGYNESPDGYAGFFRNTSSGVAVRAQTDEGADNIIEAWSSFSSQQFRVERDGDVWADGTYTSPVSSCYAVMLPAFAGLEPGDVLLIGAGGVSLSLYPNDTRVAGVYATGPAFVAGPAERSSHVPSTMVPVAVMGVVPVKASAENGPIYPGTLLVSAALPRHVMRAGQDAPAGSVLGKSLDVLEEGTGIIEMLVWPG